MTKSVFSNIGWRVKREGEATRLVRLADNANRKHMWQDAERYYAEALKHLPADGALWVQYGHSLKEQNKLAEGEAAYRKAIELMPGVADTYVQLGHALKLQKRLEEAAAAYQKAIEIDPNFEPAKQELASGAMQVIVHRNTMPDVQLQLIKTHFDDDFYSRQNPDVIAAGLDGLDHYISIGWREHRDPAPWFSTSYYLQTYGDVSRSEINPFYHYLAFGHAEGREVRRPADYRLELLASLHDYRRPEPPKADEGADPVAVLETALAKSAELYGRALTVSVSHTSYREVVAGTELVIGIEQSRYNERQTSYVHLAPIKPSNFIYDRAPKDVVVTVTVDGEVVGNFVADDIVKAIEDAFAKVSEREYVIHSALGHDLPVLIAFGKALGTTRNLFWLHDYSSSCAGYNLLRNQVRFCHLPAPDSLGCRVCIFGAERKRRIAQMSELFGAIRFIVASPSQVALDTWKRGWAYPIAGEVVIPHCRLVPTEETKAVPAADAPIRIAFVGYPVAHKGWPTFVQLVDANRLRTDYKFYHFISSSFTYAFDSAVERVHVETQAGNQSVVPDKLKEHDIDVVIITSPWPETFSFVTVEALAAGCAVLTLEDAGNVAALVHAAEGGKVFDQPKDLVDFVSDLKGLRSYVASRPRSTQRVEFCGTSVACANNS